MVQEKDAERRGDRGKQAHSDKADAITRGKRGLREILHTPHKKDVRGGMGLANSFFQDFPGFFWFISKK